MAGTISQRITLEGGAEIQKQLKALGDAGAAAFKQIQDAASKPITDPAQIDKTKQAINELGTALVNVSANFNQTSTAAQQTNTSVTGLAQSIKNLVLSVNAYQIAGIGIVATLTAINLAISKLVTGAGDTAKKISDQAGDLKISVPQWLKLQQAIAAAGGSNDDFIKSAGTGIKIIEQAQKEIAQLSRTFTVLNAEGEKTTVTVITGGMGALTAATAKTVTELRKFGVTAKALQSGNVLDVLKELAAIIDKMPEGAAKAGVGVKYFGDKWKDTIKILTDAQELDPLKASRQLTEKQVADAKAAADAWQNLSDAIRATKDQIGALFSVSSKARADWLSNLVDQSRELFKIWAGLSDQKQEAFVAGLGDTPAEKTFKVLVAVGKQLSGIWRDVLVPAGSKLLAIFAGISDSIGAITGSQVAAFFITATLAAAGLAVALKAISLALTPFSLLLSLFSGFGPILIVLAGLVVVFWDQFSAGATAALALIPESLHGFQLALQALFAGDFSTFWALFSASAVVAFQTIKQSILQSEGVLADFLRGLTGGVVQIPWVRTLVDGLAQIGKDLPATLLLIVNGFIALGNAATSVANIINKRFGTELTGTDIAALVIIGQLTGGLQAMASAATIAGAAMGVLIGVLGLLITAVGGLPVAIGVLVAALAALIAFNWESFKSDAVAAWDAITGAIGRAYDALLKFLGLRSQTAPAANGGSGGATGEFASGGLLGGRGTGTSDSNLAWVSRGEHIMPAAAVAQPGVLAFLEALRRSGGNLSRVLDGMGRFALGGMIPRPAMAFAAGGLAGGMSNVTIQFPGLPAIGGLRASSDVVDELHRAAALAQVRSGGRKPSRYS